MWGRNRDRKRLEAPPATHPEPKDLQWIHEPKSDPLTWEGPAKMSRDVKQPTGATADRATSRLGDSFHVKGEISGNEDLCVEGTVEGLIELGEGRLTVGAAAKLTADIIAREVMVHGSVKGNVRASEKIEIKKDGSVVGDLTMTQIVIEDGAYFKCAIEINKSAEKESDKDVYPPAR